MVQAPVATGKSRLAVALSRWAASWDQRATICPPVGVLQRQYEEEFSDLASLWGAAGYRCQGLRTTCDKTKRKIKGGCKGCPHAAAVARAKASCTRLMNHYTLLGTRRSVGYPQLLVLDEAHRVVDFLREQVGVKFWRHLHPWPEELQRGGATKEDVLRWLERKPDAAKRQARQLILSDPDGALVTTKQELYRNRLEWCLRVEPFDVRGAKPLLWPRSVKKLVLLSATIGRKDVEELGVDQYYNVHYVSCSSPIPPQARPLYYVPGVDMAYANYELAVPELAKLVTQAAAGHPDEAGIVHATYELAEQLQPLLTDSRFMWHTRGNQQQVFSTWVSGAAGRNRVLVASGLAEGVDLKGDRARWQVLTKVPYPSLAEPAVAHRAERDQEWFAWQAVKQLVQAYGRVCRTPTDYGATYLFDSQFERLYRDRQYLFPEWLQQAVRRLA